MIRILVGDALARLAELPDESVHCAVTSPPYWGLRDYGTPPGIWGGEPDCFHEWGVELVDNSRRTPGLQGSTINGTSHLEAGRFDKKSNFCARCGAWLGHLGLEPTPDLYVEHMVAVFREVRRVLRSDGTLWLNLGDCYATGAGKVGDAPGGGEQGERWKGNRGTRTEANSGKQAYLRRGATNTTDPKARAGVGPMTQPNRMPIAGLKPKDLVGIPWRVAFALQADGWWIRRDVIWHKPNPMPESTSDRCTTSHEYLFHLSKSERYYYDADAIAEPATYAGAGQDETGFKSPADFDGKNSDGGPRGHRKTGARSGNKERKPPSARGAPAGHGGDVAGSVPWAGATRNKRSVWTIATSPFPEAHFATFPPALVEPCVEAGTSQRGCCASCCAPWERITAEVETGETHKMPDGMATHAGSHATIHKEGREKGATDNAVTASVTLGWYPSCDCAGLPELQPYPKKPGRAASPGEAAYKSAVKRWRQACSIVDGKRRILCDAAAPIKTIPAVVLDPFGGAGTTALVADRLLRDAVLIELNADYAEMAQRRLKRDGGMFSAVEIERPRVDEVVKVV